MSILICIQTVWHFKKVSFEKKSRHEKIPSKQRVNYPREKIFEFLIINIYWPISYNICFGCSKELSHWDASFEYPQHMSWLRSKKNNFQLRTHIWRPRYSLKCLIKMLPVSTTTNDAQRRKRALMGRFSHFQFLTFFNRYMFKLLISVLFVWKLYTSVLKYGFV